MKSTDGKKIDGEFAELKIGDETYKFPILKSADGRPAFDISTLRKKSGYTALDYGFTSTSSCESKVTRIDGINGVLEHRGYKIEDLAENYSYEEVFYLLFHGQLPDNIQLNDTRQRLLQAIKSVKVDEFLFEGLPQDGDPMHHLAFIMSKFTCLAQQSEFKTRAERWSMAIEITAQMAVATALVKRYYNNSAEDINSAIKQIDTSLCFSDMVLVMMFADASGKYEIDADVSKVFNQVLILHADHEQNASTSTVRGVASSGAHPYAAIVAGITSLSGPLHGGANAAVLKQLAEIGAADKVQYHIDNKVKTKESRLMGVGHRVYRTFDPRAAVLKKTCLELLKKLNLQNPMLEVALKIEEIVAKDPYFTDRKLAPNVDFYSGIVYKALDIDKIATVIFALGRISGWMSHYNEAAEDSNTKIIRPRQLYTGHIGAKL